MNKAYSAGGIVIKNEDNIVKILLVKHEDGFLVFPKGHIDEGETEEQTALREVEEETGLRELSIIRKIGEVVRPSIEWSGETVEKTIHLFLMKSKNFDHGDADEEYGWFTYIEALEGMGALGFKEEQDFLKKYWNEISNNQG